MDIDSIPPVSALIYPTLQDTVADLTRATERLTTVVEALTEQLKAERAETERLRSLLAVYTTNQTP